MDSECCFVAKSSYLCTALTEKRYMVPVVQLVRASDCGSECRGFESHRAPKNKNEVSSTSFLFLDAPGTRSPRYVITCVRFFVLYLLKMI